MGLAAGTLDRRVRIERKVPDESLDAAGSEEWVLVAEVWASVQDVLPSRAERLADGINIASRPARVRMRYRTDVTAAMRITLGGRMMQIIAGPAEIGRREGLELMVEETTSSGNA